MRVIANRLLHIVHKINTNKILTFLDVGSTNAVTSLNLTKIFDNSMVYTFEPVRQNYEQCEKTVNKHLAKIKGRIQLQRIALDSVTGPLPFWEINDTVAAKHGAVNRGMNSKREILNPRTTAYEYNIQRQTTVVGYRLDEWCIANNVSNIDGMLMDVQGSELDVLVGAGSVLGTVQFIIADLYTKPYFHMQPSKSEIDAYLESQGFVEWVPARLAISSLKMSVIYLNSKLVKL